LHCRELRPQLTARRADQLIVWPVMHFEPVEARCDLLDRIQLFEGVLDPVLLFCVVLVTSIVFLASLQQQGSIRQAAHALKPSTSLTQCD